LHAYILENIGLKNNNYYSWTREVHKVMMMRIIVCTKRTISKSFGKPKNLLALKVWNATKEGRSGCVICHDNC
jgi:hypothetical protein